MKKIFLTIALSCAVAGASAAVTTPQFFSQDFIEMSVDNDYPTDGWLTLGNGAKPNELDATYFDANGEGPYYCIINYGTMSIPFATTDFKDNTPADQWLISPEIYMPYDEATLYFEVCSYTAMGRLGNGESDRHPYKVMISEGGTDKSDFTPLFSADLMENSTKEVTTQARAIGFTGYKGKNVRIAFVAEGSNVGFTGFTNIVLGQYMLEVNANFTPAIVKVGDIPAVDYNLKIKAPVTCPSVKGVLEIDDKVVDTKEVKRTFGSPTSYTLQIARFNFERATTIKDESGVNYKLTITPDFEGAVPTVITGSLNVAQFEYPANVVIEECTASGCGYCPRGMAAMDYYKDNYKGGENQGKAIGIAIHGYMNYLDPMSLGVEDYLAKIMSLNRTTGLPQGIFNRSTRGVSEIDKSELEKQLAQTSYNIASIKKVEVPEAEDIYALYGKPVKVNFDVTNGYDCVERNLSASVVLVENNVKGSDKGYNQENYYATWDESRFLNTFGAYGAGQWLMPNLEKFLSGGELAQSDISFNKMTYQHVARGVFPSFFGVNLKDSWTAGDARNFDLEFKFPENVMNLDNVEAVLLITDNETNCIVASDIVPASSFIRYDLSGVDNITLSGVAISKRNGSLHVEAPADSTVQLYKADGANLGTYAVDGALDLSLDLNGVVVVRVSTSEGVQSAKLVF